MGKGIVIRSNPLMGLILVLTLLNLLTKSPIFISYFKFESEFEDLGF